MSVTITVAPPKQALHECFGILPDEDAEEMIEIIEREFGMLKDGQPRHD